MSKDDYFVERNEKNLKKLNEIKKELPPFCEEFFVGVSSRMSPLTRLAYAQDLRVFFTFLQNEIYHKKISVTEITLFDLERLTPFNIEQFLQYLESYAANGKRVRCGDKTKERKLSTLKSFFKYYYKRDRIASNVTAKVDMPKVHQKEIVRLEIDEVVKILNTVENGSGLTGRQNGFWQRTKLRDTAILTLFLGTGVRVSELVGLNIADIDLSTESFTITRKGGNRSRLFFGSEVAKALKPYIDERNEQNKTQNNPALFLSLQKTRITVRSVETLVKKYAKIISPLKRISPHKLRSTFGTNLYRETGDIYVVAEVLGHNDINTTKKHYAASSEELRRHALKSVKLRETDPDEP